MKAFHYRLQRLWEVARGIREQRAVELAAARASLAQAEALRAAAIADRLAAEAHRIQAAARGVPLAVWEHLVSDLATRRLQGQALEASLDRGQDDVRQSQEAFLQARRQERALEALRTRALEAWRLEAEREDQRTLDESAASAAQRAGTPRGGERP